MLHILSLRITPDSLTDISDLCKYAVVAIYEQLRSGGITPSDEEPRQYQQPDMWTAVVKLAPEGSGLLIMSVWDTVPPYSVMFALRDDALTEMSYPVALTNVQEQMAGLYRVEAITAFDQTDDIAAGWLDDEIKMPEPSPQPSQPEARGKQPVGVRLDPGCTALWLGMTARQLDTIPDKALQRFVASIPDGRVKVDTSSGSPQSKGDGYYVVYDLDPPLVGRLEIVVSTAATDPHMWMRLYEGMPGAFNLIGALQEVGQALFSEDTVEWGMWGG